MSSYFDDLTYRIVLQHYITHNDTAYQQAETNSLELLTSGKLDISWKDGCLTRMEAPAFFWIREGSVFSFSLPEPNIKTEHIYLDFLGERSFRMMDALDMLYPDGWLRLKDVNSIKQIFLRLLNLYRNSPEEKRNEMVVLTEQLMLLVEDSINAKNVSLNNDQYALAKLAEDMRSDPFKNWDLTHLAASYELSVDHFRRIFRIQLGMTPREYILHQRMTRAAELLQNTNMRIKEIEQVCGFQSVVDFSRSFKKCYGKSPSQYREKR